MVVGVHVCAYIDVRGNSSCGRMYVFVYVRTSESKGDEVCVRACFQEYGDW